MKNIANRFSVALTLCLVFTIAAVAQIQQRDMQKEEKIWQELQKTSPESVEKFKAATEALDQQKYDEAAKLYDEVLQKSPEFQPALRRAGAALVILGNRGDGIALTQLAVDLERSPENLISLATDLVTPGTLNYTPNEEDLKKASLLATEAMNKSTDANDPSYALITADLALSANNLDAFNSAVNTLKIKFPDDFGTHYFVGIKAANDGDFSTAETEIKKAEELGMPAESTQQTLALIQQVKDDSGYWIWDYFYYALYIIGAWMAGLVILFIVGKILSVKLLRSVENSDPNDITGGGQAGLKRVYKYVIGIAGAYYYISQPVVMFLVLALTAAIFVFFLWIGQIPVKLLLIIGFVSLATIFYMLKSFFVKVESEDPGRALTEAEAPGIWALARDVAMTLNTRPVNEIRITPGTELAVYERGGLRERMQDNAERILIIGTAVLNDFNQNAFRAVLAHEYGHFSNRDTAGGDTALRVNNHIIQLANAMAAGGAATFYNVAFQFLRIYHFLFRRITHGATRLQEILADRVAVYLYGAEAFKEGLSHVIRREVEFKHVAEAEINTAFGANRALQNLYEMSVSDEQIKGNLQKQSDEIINRPTTEDDTHPSPSDRFKLANRITSRECAPISGQVWELFTDRTALTKEMNELLEKQIRSAMYN